MCFTTRPDPDIRVPPRPITTHPTSSRPTSRIAVAVITPPLHSTHSSTTTTSSSSSSNGLPIIPPPRRRSRSRSRSEIRRTTTGGLVTVETISPRSSGQRIIHPARSPRGSGTLVVHSAHNSPRLSGGSLAGSPRRQRSITAAGLPRHHSNTVVLAPTPPSPYAERTIITTTTPRQSGNIVRFEDEEVLVVRPVRSRGYSSNGGVGGKDPRQSVGSVRSLSYRGTREKIVEVDDVVGGDRRGYERREGGRRSR